MDYCLKTPTQEAMDALLKEIGLINEEGYPTDNHIALDRIGPISRVVGQDDAGEPIVKTDDSYHANLRILKDVDPDTDAKLQTISVEPTQPQYRVWA